MQSRLGEPRPAASIAVASNLSDPGAPQLAAGQLRLVLTGPRDLRDPREQRHSSASPSRPLERVAPQRVRIADAATQCVARRGVTKTTLDDVAREAGCSRATVYRTFPGGKEEVIAAVVDTEVARLFSSIAVAMGGADDLEDAVVAGIVATASAIEEHAALSYVLDKEPGVVLPHLCFAPMDRVIDTASRFHRPVPRAVAGPGGRAAAGRLGDADSPFLLGHPGCRGVPARRVECAAPGGSVHHAGRTRACA